MYGDQSRQASNVIANNSPSNLPAAPLMSFYISGLEYNQKWMQDPTFVDKTTVRQRAYNEDTRTFEQTQGQAFSVERIMPTPYTLRITVDVWTTNYNQKLELIEQLGTIFNPGLELQSTDNFIDWTSLSTVFQESLSWSSRTIPQGTGNPIDILSWKFYMPIWLSNPMKLKKMGVIHKIIASIYKGSDITDMSDDDLLLGTRQKITPYGYKLLLIGNQLQILPAAEPFYPSNVDLELPPSPDTNIYWSGVLNMYGQIRPGISQIWLENPYMDTEIVGTIALNPLDDRVLIYNIDPDTLPQNTLDAVDMVVNPLQRGPGAGLATAAIGQRYLIVESIGGNSSTIAWGNLVANANDIVEYNGTNWYVSFDSETSTTVQYVTNLNTSVQYRYVNSEGVWMKAYEGWYDQGDYSIVI